MLFWFQFTLSGEKLSGESDENFEGLTKFSPEELNPRFSGGKIVGGKWPKLLPKILFSNLLQPKIKSKFLNPELQKWML